MPLVSFLIAWPGSADLLGRQRLDRKGGEDHVFDAEAGIDVSSRSAKSAARWRGSRLGRAVPRRIRSTRPSTR